MEMTVYGKLKGESVADKWYSKGVPFSTHLQHVPAIVDLDIINSYEKHTVMPPVLRTTRSECSAADINQAYRRRMLHTG